MKYYKFIEVCRRDCRIPIPRRGNNLPSSIYPTEPTAGFRKLNSPKEMS